MLTNKSFLEGLNYFNNEMYLKAHEPFEDIWKHAKDEKLFLQGLIQISVAFYHYNNQNLRSAMILLKRGNSYIKEYKEIYNELNLELFCKDIDNIIKLIEKNETIFFPKLNFI